MNRLLTIALCLCTTPAAAQDQADYPFVDLKSVPAPVDIQACRQALTMGQVLSADGNVYSIFLDPLLFIIKVDEDGMLCRAVRHVNK